MASAGPSSSLLSKAPGRRSYRSTVFVDADDDANFIGLPRHTLPACPQDAAAVAAAHWVSHRSQNRTGASAIVSAAPAAPPIASDLTKSLVVNGNGTMGKSLPKRKRGKPSMQDPTPASAPYAPANKKCPANGVGDIATPSTNDSIGISSGGENCPVTSFDDTLDTHQPQVPSVPSSSYSTTVPNPEAPTTPTLPPNPIARHPRFLSRAPSPPPNLDGSIYIGRIISPGSIRLAAAGAPRVRPAIRFDETATSSRSSPEIGQDLPGGEVWPALKIGSADDFSAAAAAAAEAEQVSAAVAEKKAAVVASIRSILSSKSEWDARPLSSVHSISEEGTRDYFEEMGYPSDVASRNFDESFRFDNTLASNTAKLLSVSPASTAADPYTAAADFATARSMSACPSLSSVTTVTSPQEKDKYRKPLPRQGYRNLEASEPQLHQQEGTLQHVETKEIVVKENDGDVDVKYNQLPPLPSSKALTYDIASRLRAATRIEPTRFSSASGSSSSSHGETLIEVIDVDLLFADGVPLPESSRMKGVHLFVENEVIEVDDEGLDDDLEDLDDDDDEVEKVPPARVKPEPVLPKARCIRGSSASSDLTEVSSPQNRVAAMDLTTESAVSVPSQSNSLPPLKLAKPAGTGRWRFLEASDPPLRHGSPAPQGLELQDGCGAPHPAAWPAAGAVAPAAEGDNTWMEAPVQPEIPNWTGDATPWNGGVVTEPVDGDGRSLPPWQPPEVSAPSFCEQSGDAGWVGDDGWLAARLFNCPLISNKQSLGVPWVGREVWEACSILMHRSRSCRPRPRRAGWSGSRKVKELCELAIAATVCRRF